MIARKHGMALVGITLGTALGLTTPADGLLEIAGIAG